MDTPLSTVAGSRVPGGRAPASRTRALACVALLLVQLGAIVHARFGAARYFCWAPFDTQTRYTLAVTLPGRGALSEEELLLRYRLPGRGQDDRSPQHVMDVIRQYEQTYGKSEGARVLLRYSVNGRPPGEWRWPPR